MQCTINNTIKIQLKINGCLLFLSISPALHSIEHDNVGGWVSVSASVRDTFFFFLKYVTKLFKSVTNAIQSVFERSKIWQIFTL